MGYCVQCLCYCQGYWIFRKNGDICQFIRGTYLFTSRVIVTPPPLLTSLYNAWIFCEDNYSYSHYVVVDSLFNVPPICLFIPRLWFLFCYLLLCTLSSFAIILTRKMELAALSSCPPDV